MLVWHTGSSVLVISIVTVASDNLKCIARPAQNNCVYGDFLGYLLRCPGDFSLLNLGGDVKMAAGFLCVERLNWCSCNMVKADQAREGVRPACIEQERKAYWASLKKCSWLAIV